MANVTNVILTTTHADRGNAEKLNTLGAFRYEEVVVSCDETRVVPERWYGGDTRLGMNVMVGTDKELDLPKLVHFMRGTPWHDPDHVQLFICDHDDLRFVEIDWQHSEKRPEHDRIEL